MKLAKQRDWSRSGLAVVALIVSIASGCGEPPPPPPPPQAAAPPPPKPISLDPIPELVVRAGTSGTARIEVNRAGHAGEATVTVAPPSDPGLTVTAEPIGGDTRTGTIVVTAAETMGMTESIVPVQVTVTLDGMTAQENLSVKVPPFEAPTFEPDGAAILQPGRKGKATFRVDRKGYVGRPIELGDATGVGADGQPPATPPTDAPREITCTAVTIADDSEVATIEFSVVPEAPDGPRTVMLSGSTMGRPFPAEFKVDVLAHPYGVVPQKAVSLAPGETKQVPLTITRPAYAGPIDVAIANLPAGVTAERVIIAAESESGSLVLTASSDAEPRVRSANVRTTGGPFGLDEVVVVRVARPGEEAVLPAAVTSGEVGRPRKPGVMSGRLTSAARRALADLYGGTPESEAAVTRGLAWLARVQQPEGSWTLKGGSGTPSPDAPSDPEPPADPTLATALAVLPFLGEGISHQRAPNEPTEYQNYKTVVEKGLVFLCMNQMRDRSKADGFLKGGMEGHSLATIAIAEDYALSRDDRLKLHIRQAVKFLGAMQNQDGSWGREPGGQGDLVTTCWAVQALRAVQAAGLGTSMRPLKKAQQFVEACAAGPADATMSQYRLSGSQPVTPLATAAGLAAQLELGKAADDPDVRSGGAFLLKNTSGPMPYAFLATEALRAVGGEEFDVWNHSVRENLVRRQRQSGDLDGSWDPDGEDGGRMEATALSLVTLQVYYRHLPKERDLAKKSAVEDAEAEAADASGDAADGP